jgi:hypothetical protein
MIADDGLGPIKDSRKLLELSDVDATRQAKQLGFGPAE